MSAYVDVDPVSMLITADTLRTAGNVKGCGRDPPVRTNGRYCPRCSVAVSRSSRAMDSCFRRPPVDYSQYKTGEIQIHLKTRGIATDVHYPVPEYRQPSIQLPTCLPVTDQLCAEVLTLPLFPEMTAAHVGPRYRSGP